jgi:O-antigen/teichoic acid export membrane protein
VWADVGSMFGLLAKQTDVLVLGLFRGPVPVGYYSLAESVASFAGNIASPLQSVVYPRLAQRRGSGDAPGLWDEVRASARRIGIPLAALSLLSLPLVPLGIRLTVGSHYLAAVPATRILILAGTVWLALFWVRPLLLTLGSVRWLALLTGISGVLTLGGMLAVAPRFGATGVALVELSVGVGVQAASLLHLTRARRPFVQLEPA